MLLNMCCASYNMNVALKNLIIHSSQRGGQRSTEPPNGPTLCFKRFCMTAVLHSPSQAGLNHTTRFLELKPTTASVSESIRWLLNCGVIKCVTWSRRFCIKPKTSPLCFLWLSTCRRSHLLKKRLLAGDFSSAPCGRAKNSLPQIDWRLPSRGAAPSNLQANESLPEITRAC